MDINPYWSYPQKEEVDDEDATLAGMDNERPEGWCLVTVDIHNRHVTPFEVTLERTQPGTLFQRRLFILLTLIQGCRRLSTSQLVSPRSTVR